MIAAGEVFLTGGEGRLGTELRGLLDGIVAPTLAQLDILQANDLANALDQCTPRAIVHAAAYTDVGGAETDRTACWQVNVDGTRNIVREAIRREILLLHISTDYVFEGTTGGYAEDDPPGPVRNYYSLTKLAAEAVARTAPRHLVIRTSFRPREWPYPKAFTDVFTSQDYVDVIAPEIALAIRRADEIPFDTLHIATERKSAFELARRRRPDVEAGSKAGLAVQLPDDISLDTSRRQELKTPWSHE